MRNLHIDVYKGLLVILVVVGHVLLGSTSDNLLRNLIYFFHMPIFIGISGRLLNTDKLQEFNLIQLFGKYLFRVIIPWLISAMIYHLSLCSEIVNCIQSVHFWIGILIKPFYHLWFIPAFLSWVFIVWLFTKLNLSYKSQFFLSVIISISSLILTVYEDIAVELLSFFSQRNVEPFFFVNILGGRLDAVLDYFRPQYFMFFVLGSGLRERTISISFLWKSILLALCIVFQIGLFYFSNTYLSLLIFVLFNVFLLDFCLNELNRKEIKKVRFLEYIGKQSLGFYLWHMIPILIIKKIEIQSEPLYFVAMLGGLLVFSGIYVILEKQPFIKKYCFGM